jgi:hypothetical protein
MSAEPVEFFLLRADAVPAIFEQVQAGEGPLIFVHVVSDEDALTGVTPVLVALWVRRMPPTVLGGLAARTPHAWPLDRQYEPPGQAASPVQKSSSVSRLRTSRFNSPQPKHFHLYVRSDVVIDFHHADRLA